MLFFVHDCKKSGYYWQVAAIVYKYAPLKNLDNQNQKDKWFYKIKYKTIKCEKRLVISQMPRKC